MVIDKRLTIWYNLSMENQTVDIHDGDLLIRTNSEEIITLVVRNEFVPEGDHIEIKVTKEGIKMERWNANLNAFSHAFAVNFSEDFGSYETDIYEDEIEDEEEAA